MKTTENLLDIRSGIPTVTNLETSLNRLVENTISGAEAIELLDRYGLRVQLQRELIIDAELEAIECTDREILDAGQAFYRQQQINSDRDRTEWLERNHFTLERLEHSIVRTIKLDRFKCENFASKVDAYFLQRKDRLDRASYSLLRVKNLHLAQELFFRLQAGEATFAELAQQYSGGKEAENGGAIGPLELGSVHPILAQKLRSLCSGQLSPPVQAADWFAIVRLEQYWPARLDQAMRSRLMEELFDRWIQHKLTTLNQNLANQNYIENTYD
jgi:parvulin-like peptidyl-prolyl isomerase